jgi:hypothetical protein
MGVGVLVSNLITQLRARLALGCNSNCDLVTQGTNLVAQKAQRVRGHLPLAGAALQDAVVKPSDQSTVWAVIHFVSPLARMA